MRRTAAVVFVVLGCAFSVAAQAPAHISAATGAAKAKPTAQQNDVASPAVAKTSAAYGDLPLSFEENRGQTDSRVSYLARGKGYTLFLTPTKEVLALRRAIPSPGKRAPQIDATDPPEHSRSVLQFELVGADKGAQVSATDLLPGISNYYIGNDPAKWRAGIPNYARVSYRDTYAGIDVAYSGDHGLLESTFIVAPGADPGNIRMRVDGAKGLRIAENGDLILALERGSVKLQQPVAYQIVQGARRGVRTGYKFLARNELGFWLGSYDRRQNLIIDPTLAYSTYLGGSGLVGIGDGANIVVADSSGAAYVTGYTTSADFPTQNAQQGNLGTGTGEVENAFVTKFSASGTSLLYSTYLGGNAIDGGNGIAIDSAGAAYVTGSASSTNFPLLLPLPGQSEFFGFRCGYVSSFSPAGALTFSTYLCGGATDYGKAIAVDGNKDIYATGFTNSSSFPAVNAIQSSLSGTTDAYVCKLAAVTANGSSLLFSSYFGGNVYTDAQGIALDGSSPPNIYLAGTTNSTVFPTKSPIQATNNASANAGYNAWVAEVSVPAGGAASVVYSTFLGGSVGDAAYNLTADSAGNAYVAGSTFSPDFPVKNPIQTPPSSGSESVFVTKIAAGGGSLDFSTYFGGSVAGRAMDIALDTTGNIYVTGYTNALDFPTRLPLQATLNGSQSAFVTEFKGDGSDYIFSTYLGGSYSTAGGQNYGGGITVDSLGNVYVVGENVTFDFPTANPVQASLKSANGNGFVAKIAPATPAGPQLFPEALNFGSVLTGTTSQSQTVTLANGSNALDIASTAVSGPNAADFSDFTTCGQTVPATVVCTFTVKFTPSTTAPESATATINESSGTQTFTLSGTGAVVPPPGTITVNPTSVTFGSQEVGTTTTTPQLVTVSVTGTNPVTLTGFTGTGADPGDFSIGTGTTCEFETALAAGTTCKLGIVFTPSAVGSRTATIQISGTFTGTPANVMASGTGTPQIASLTPASLQFPNTVVGMTAGAMSATLTNLSSTISLTGISPTITSFLPSGTFAISANTCPASGSLGPGLSCTISVTYTPTAAGAAAGELTVADSDTGTSPQAVFLIGTGLNASATLATVSPNFLSFGRQTAGSTSNAQFVFLQNIGNTNLTFTTPLSGSNPSAFAATNTCSGTITPGGVCGLSVTFAPPTGTAVFFATLTISSSASGAPQTVGLSGTGIPASTASLLPNPLVYPAIAVGTTSAPQYAFLNNTGPNADSISNITIAGADFEDFQLSFTAPGNTPCSSSQVLNAQAVCVVGVLFTPTQTGLRTATLAITDTATGTPHTTVLQGGSGTTGPTVTVTPPSLTFGPQPVGTTSAAQSVTLSNTGTATVTFAGFTVSGTNAGDFGVPLPTSGAMCSPSGTLAGGASCTINVLFTPSAIGSRTATLNIADNATGSPQPVALIGTGAGGSGAISISPASLTFASQVVGTTSAPQTVTVSNIGGVTISFTSIVTSGDFAGATLVQCPSIPVEGEPCTFSITFTPKAAGTRMGTITFTDNATGSPQLVTLTGTGGSGTGTVTVAPSSLAFAAQPLNTTSGAESVTVSNTGSTAVNFAGFSISGANSSDFALGSGASASMCNASGSLAASASCTIGVTFTPTATGARAATLSIADNATGSPQSVSLNGTGTNAQVIISIPPGGATTATATPGGSAYYGLEITGATGVSGTVQLGCTPSSPTITCNVIPNTIVLTGKPVEVAFGIQTFCQGATASTGFMPPGGRDRAERAMLLLALLLSVTTWMFRRRRQVAVTFATLVLVALGSAACNSLPQGPNGVTPAGTYNLTLTTTLNGQTQTFPNFLTLMVK
jgi:hypothetical protein